MLFVLLVLSGQIRLRCMVIAMSGDYISTECISTVRSDGERYCL